jgi:hypothetical protein
MIALFENIFMNISDLIFMSMSSPDMFENSPGCPLSPHPVCSNSSNVESLPSQSPITATPPSPTPPTPTPPTPTRTPDSYNPSPFGPVKSGETKNVACMIKVDFLDIEGKKVRKSLSCSNSEVVSIVSSMLKSNSIDYCRSTVNKICRSELFKNMVEEQVLKNISCQFQTFLSKQACPLKIGEMLASPHKVLETDFDEILLRCYEECPNLVNAIIKMCLGFSSFRNIMEDSNNKYPKQSLFAIIVISAFTRKQKVNLYKSLWESF